MKGCVMTTSEAREHKSYLLTVKAAEYPKVIDSIRKGRRAKRREPEEELVSKEPPAAVVPKELVPKEPEEEPPTLPAETAPASPEQTPLQDAPETMGNLLFCK